VHGTRLHDSLQVPRLASQHSRRMVYAVFVLASSALSIGTITAVAYWSSHPLVVPSLGPTAFMVFNRSQTPEARPRNIVVGHLIGAIAGYVALTSFGLLHAPPVTQGGLSPSRIGAAALSIALTTGAMILLRAEHGPAGATTLIVSLGFITTVSSLALLMAGVIALAIEGVAIDRFVGLRIPYWSGLNHSAGRHSQSLIPHPFGRPGPSSNGHRDRPDPQPTPRLIPFLLEGNHSEGWAVAPGQGRHLLGPEECIVKVEDARTDGWYSILELVLDPRSPCAPLHSHYEFAESYVVVTGAVEARIAQHAVRAGPGSIIHVPAGVPHELHCRGREPATCLCITPHSQQSQPEFLP
jgi:CBS domain-containing membrane protein